VDLFISRSEPSIVNFVLRLADLSGASQQQNVTFRLSVPDNNGVGSSVSVVPFGFMYVIGADPSERLINSISVTQGGVLGGTPVVVMLRYFMGAFKSAPADSVFLLCVWLTNESSPVQWV
jgi:hypothetical protein